MQEIKEIIDSDRCTGCFHFSGGTSCLAFKIIPDEIFHGENLHIKPLPNQGNNIVYTEYNPKKNIL